MTREEAIRFKENWAVVNQLIIEEERRKSPAERLKELTLLYRIGKALGWRQLPTDDEEIVRARWQKLREKLGARSNDGQATSHS